MTEPKSKSLARGFAKDDFNGISEKTSSFANRNDVFLAVNASTFDVNTNELRGINVQGEQIFKGQPNIYGRTYLIYKEGKLGYTSDPLKEKNIDFSLVGFFPIIVNKENVIHKFDEDYPHKGNPNPQQIIYQYSDGQIGFLTVEGRSNNQRGLTIEECCDILIEHNVDFAYLLDGGGSISTCINGFMVNDAPERSGERPVKDFLYFKE